MIAAIWHDLPVVIEDANFLSRTATIRSLTLTSLGDHYVGGLGYLPTRYATVPQNELEAISLLDPATCDELRNWIDAMKDTDALADSYDPEYQPHPAIMAAEAIEEAALKRLIEFIHTRTLPRLTA